MSVALFIAAAVAVGVLAARKGASAWRRRAFAQSKGIHPLLPIEVSSFREPRRWVRKVDCHCGGRLYNIGEGPSEGAHRYRVTTECELCRQVHVFRFDTSKVAN